MEEQQPVKYSIVLNCSVVYCIVLYSFIINLLTLSNEQIMTDWWIKE